MKVGQCYEWKQPNIKGLIEEYIKIISLDEDNKRCRGISIEINENGFVSIYEFTNTDYTTIPRAKTEITEDEFEEKTERLIKLYRDQQNHTRECLKELFDMDEEGRLTDDEIREMMKGIVTFSKEHDFTLHFGDKKERYMTPDNHGTIEMRMKCGCSITFGYLGDGTYHLHSMSLLGKDGTRQELFEV